MGKGIAAMTFLPKTSITIVDGDPCSIEAIKALLSKIADMQSNEEAAISAQVVTCKGKNAWQNADWTITSQVGASGTVTLASVLAADTVTVNGLVYTAVAGAKADNTEFSIDGTDTVDGDDLVDSINNDTRIGTLPYTLSASNAAGVVTITASPADSGANAITLVSSNGTRLAVSGATLSGGVGYSCTFSSEVSNLSDDAIGRPALSTRRLIDPVLDATSTSFTFTVRSLMAVLKFIEKLEDEVASTGVSATGDATYTDVVLKGTTPYESFTWTVQKAGAVYTITPTATS